MVCTAMSPLHCLTILFQLISVSSLFDTLIELGSHYANRTLFVSCTKDTPKSRANDDVLNHPIACY